MAISGSFLIDRVTKFQTLFDSFRTKVEQLVDYTGNLAIGHIHVATPVSVHEDVDRACYTDSIAHLYKHFVGNTCRNHILSNVTGSISGTTVHLAGVFSGESTTTVSAFATVSIHNNLAACQTGISVRTTDHELSGRIDVIDDLIIEQCQYFIMMNRSNDTGHQDFDNVTTDDRQHFFVSFELCFGRVISRLNKVIVLRRNNNSINTDRSSVVVIFNRHLALGVRTEVGHHLFFAADISQHLQNAVCQIKRKRHIVFCLVRCIAEHHALIARTLFHRVLTLYATVDVGTLLMNGRKHTARVTFEHVLSFSVTDFLNHFTCDELEVNVRFSFHFTR